MRDLLPRLAIGLVWARAFCHASVITTAVDARLASRELFEYYDIDTSISFPCPPTKAPTSKSLKGKGGKGKGSKGLPPPPKSKKGAKYPKGCIPPKEPPPPPPPKSKSSKSLIPPGKGKGIAPPTNPIAPSKPTPPTPNPATSMPPASSPSAVVTSTNVTASPFTIAYTITTIQIPTTTDYDGLAAMTSDYLQRIFAAASSQAPGTVLETSTTSITNQSFTLNMPVAVDWSSILTFGPGSVPTIDDIDKLITASFTQNSFAYQAQLAALTNNIFSTTTSFNFTSSAPAVQSQEQPQSSSLSAAATASIAVAAGAGAFLLLIGGLMIHRRKEEIEDDDDANVVQKDDGHMTVAGDTLAGTMSINSGARQLSEEEEAGPIERSEWEAYAKYSTAEYRKTSPNSSGNESDGSDESDGRYDRIDLSPRTRRTLDDVDI